MGLRAMTAVSETAAMKQLMTCVALMIAAALAACGGSQKPAAARAPTCEDAGANTEKVVMALVPTQGESMRAMATVGHAVIAARCPVDGWSAEVIACMAHAPDADQAQACAERLTPTQHQAMVDAFGAGMQAQPGGGAMKASAPSEGAPPSDPCGGGE